MCSNLFWDQTLHHVRTINSYTQAVAEQLAWRQNKEEGLQLFSLTIIVGMHLIPGSRLERAATRLFHHLFFCFSVSPSLCTFHVLNSFTDVQISLGREFTGRHSSSNKRLKPLLKRALWPKAARVLTMLATEAVTESAMHCDVIWCKASIPSDVRMIFPRLMDVTLLSMASFIARIPRFGWINKTTSLIMDSSISRFNRLDVASK